jgi:hypothetical protein
MSRDTADKRPVVNDPRPRTNDDLETKAERWAAFKAQQAKRRGEITAAKKPRAK